MTRELVLSSLVLCLAACSSCESDTAETPATTLAPVGPSALLDTDGTLASGGTTGVDFDVEVEAGANLTIQVTASAFDPVVAVRPPGSGVLSNDDWQGSRTESRVSVVATQAGVMKVTVMSFQPDAAGAFHVRVTTAAQTANGESPVATSAMIPAGGQHTGELGPGDPTLEDGRFHESVVLAGADQGPLELRINAVTENSIPTAIVMDPHGRALSPSGGGHYVIVEPGSHRLQLLGPTPGATAGYSLSLTAASAAGDQPVTPTLARSHHQLPTSAATASLTLGQVVQGSLDATDPTLPTGESADVYSMVGTVGQHLHAELEAAFDAYLMVIGPSGRHWENDDSGGGTDSTVELTLPADGTYRIVATAYRAGLTGAYSLKTGTGTATTPAQVNVATTAAQNAAPGRQITGRLEQGDTTLDSGEFADAHELTFAAGERVHLTMQSTEFDTYLIMRPPTGAQVDNDDVATGVTNSALDFVATAGTYRILATSYQAGESGAYTLGISGSAGNAAPTSPTSPTPTAPNTTPQTPAVAAVGPAVTGTLAAGDATLPDGEFTDVLTRTFTQGEAVNISLTSSSFDPYLIVVSPSGHQMDNDDLNANTRDAGIRIPAAEAGEYRITVTSYEARETGAYTLSFEAGAAVPRANNAGGGGARVFGIFAGISDYPNGVGDLPECANDAIKLAEALRNRGLLDPSRQVLLTDGEATRANVTAAMTRFAGEMGPDDIFIFFYSGHGGQTRSSNDPREIDGTDEFLVLHDGQLLDDDLGRQFDSIRAGTSVIALDACFSGGFAKDLITRPGRVGLFSSEEDVLSAVASQFQAGGYLSHFLRTAVSGDADTSPRDSVLTVGELTHFLYTQFGTHATDVQLQGAYQHLVVDRGAVHVDQVLWSYQ